MLIRARILVGIMIFTAAMLIGAVSLAVQASEMGAIVEPNVDILYQHNGEGVSDGFGWIGRRLDDFNADGVDDYLISAPFYQTFTTFFGRVYVYSGIDGSMVISHTGNGPDLLGYDAAIAGDINKDGTPDYILGAPFASSAYVYSGVDHTKILTISSGIIGDWFGSGVRAIEDVDGDTYSDLIIGSTRFSPSATMTATGRVGVYSGQDGHEIWSVEGTSLFGQQGNGVAVATDLNEDGIDEVIVSAAFANGGNGEVFILSGADGAELHRFDPAPPLLGGTFGRFFVDGQHDVNNDGIDDIYIGDYGAITGTGRAYVYSGADLMAHGNAATPLYQFEGSGVGEGLGVGRFVPDANKDGHDDIIIASWQSNEYITGSGKVEIYSGADGTVLATATGAIPFDAMGVDALHVGDLDGDENDEYLLTAVGLDFAGADVGKGYLVSLDRSPSAVVLNQTQTSSLSAQPLLIILLGLVFATVFVIRRGNQNKTY